MQEVTRRFPLRIVSATVLVVLVGASLAAAWGTRALVRSQERRLLTQRTSEVALVLNQSIAAIPQSLAGLGTTLQDTGGSITDFDRAAATEVSSGQGRVAYAWLRPQATGYQVIAAAGPGITVGETVTGAPTGAFDQAMRVHSMVPVLFGAGRARTLGFAVGPPTAPAGTVLYRQQVLGPVSAPRAAGTAPFAELDVILYATPTARPDTVLVATTTQKVLSGAADERLKAGTGVWLLAVAARGPLVGGVAANAQWIALGLGLLGSVLVATVVEMAARRRDAALALYAAEHQVAETLQLSLLPEIPPLPDLDLAARYIAGGSGQQVGGDWFDLFPVADDRVGLVVGDVIGHDIAAASAMSQVRSALRAYAWQGGGPAQVLDRVDRLVAHFAITPLVTVMFGLLSGPDRYGDRTLVYGNAGHPPPLLLLPDGTVRWLDLGGSVIIGAPTSEEREESSCTVPAGSTLVLYTDGLVESPRRTLDAAMAQLADVVGQHPAGEGAEAMCDRVLRAMCGDAHRDDVVLLVIRSKATGPGPTPPSSDPETRTEQAASLRAGAAES